MQTATSIPPAAVAVVGGGIIGLATARELLLRNVGRVVVLEAENKVAAHQSGRNSGVVHAGVYYAPGSLKARLCLSGMRRTYDYCEEHQIPYKKVGKLIVALHEWELPALHRLHQNSLTNQVPGISLLESNAQIRSIEPECSGIAAIHSPETGIVDWGCVARAYADDIHELGGEVYLRSTVIGLSAETQIDKPVNVSFCREKAGEIFNLQADRVITCAGAQSDRVAELSGGERYPRIIPVRGEYLQVRNEALAKNIRGNIYPVPDSGSGSPFLGVHFTPTMNGEMLVGPNAVLALARDGYEWTDFRWKDVKDMLSYKGFWHLAKSYWRYGLKEMYRSLFVSAATSAARQYVPALKADDFERRGSDRSGIRGQAVAYDGKLVDDFLFETSAGGRILHTRNAPSPGATSSLAIAELVVDKSLELDIDKFQSK